ncbi:hypothetical protein BDV28DRAFT_162414 [Aspergillus coremiiformis]|uniref:Lipase n=1 Tax=Aspergillus coremiiformis TaxID=138285 RepID=A0A5N6Z5U4_9EURO|nr:hypothetical protein BDV28DRAFT_162414 [Aspergillus coremiiformis]
MRIGLVMICCVVASPIDFDAVVHRDDVSSASHLELISTLSVVANDPSTRDTLLSQIAPSILSNLTQTRSPESSNSQSVQSTWDKLSSLFQNGSMDILEYANEIAASGQIPPTILPFLNGYVDIDDSSNHRHNPSLKNPSIYPLKAKGDAPYAIAEDVLRAAIHIPSSFSNTTSNKTPVLLVPGTAVPAAMTFYFNFAKLGNAFPEGDIFWVTIPHSSLGDIQSNVEYVAYALNYVSALSASKIAVISWSQGGLDIQWALKYWPSTRDVVSDFIAISPDFHGTVIEWLVCPLLKPLACTPSIWQQGWDANLIKVLRGKGGDSAYVPTTTVYSSFDEVVQPMSGENASAVLLDARGVGVSNNHIQTICANKPAGGVYTHQGMLCNPLAWALALDALRHGGPGNITRIDIKKVCKQVVPPHLEMIDLLGTEALALVALSELLAYSPKVSGEPNIVPYAS